MGLFLYLYPYLSKFPLKCLTTLTKAYYSISQESFGVLPWSLTQSELPLRHPFTLLVAAFLTTLKNVLMKSVIDSFPQVNGSFSWLFLPSP